MGGLLRQQQQLQADGTPGQHLARQTGAPGKRQHTCAKLHVTTTHAALTHFLFCCPVLSVCVHAQGFDVEAGIVSAGLLVGEGMHALSLCVHAKGFDVEAGLWQCWVVDRGGDGVATSRGSAGHSLTMAAVFAE